jgi:quercetin dioxygenase-like cupin family protein
MKHVRVMMAALVLAAAAASGAAGADPLNPKALAFKLPEQIPWKRNAAGTTETAVVYGDPEKPGLYAVLTKWLPGNMSRPHWHANDRVITVLKGTWWVGTGEKYDPESTVAMPAGTVVTHFGKEVHYDGAKDGEAVLMIVGEGPATSTPASTPAPAH